MIQIQSTYGYGVQQGIKGLVYGDSGTGKTRLMATAPYPFLISAEGGFLSLRNFNLPFVEIRSMVQLIEVYQWCLRSQEAYQFATICMDSASEIADVVLRTEMGKSKDPRKAYGELLIQMLQLIRDFRDLPSRNVIIVAKQEWSKDETTGVMMFQPMMPGQKLGPQLPYFFDEVFQQCVFTDQTTHKPFEALRTRRDHQNVAKDRSGALDEWEVPNLELIFRKILGQQHAV